MSKYQMRESPFGHSRIISVVRPSEPQVWDVPRPTAIIPQGHVGRPGDDLTPSQVYDETWEVSMGRLRRVAR